MRSFKDDTWSENAHLIVAPKEAGDWIELELSVQRTGKYRVAVVLTKAADYGIVQVHVSGKKMGEPIDCFAADPPANLLPALGVLAQYVGKNRIDYVVEVESEQGLRQVAPDFRLLETIPCRGVIVTSRSADPQFDFASRAFFPRLGVDEDPVCGSAHCCLGAFWRKRLGKSEFLAYQASARGGVVKVRIQGDRVFLGGRAVIVAKGELVVD
jgi:predicted PhzF superfamily epimerase YddE/YHI9